MMIPPFNPGDSESRSIDARLESTQAFPKHLSQIVSHLRAVERDNSLTAYVGAMCVGGGSILSLAMNHSRLNVYCALRAPGYPNGTHAEVAAIFQVRKKVDLGGTKMFVARVKRNGEIAMAQPCRMCRELIRSYGIKRVFFTIDENTYGVWKPS